RNDDFGIPFWRVAHEPCVIEEFLLLADAIAGSVADDLRGAGLAGEFNALESELSASATLVDHAIHVVGDLLDGRVAQRERFFRDILRVLQHMRLHELAARGDAADEPRKL